MNVRVSTFFFGEPKWDAHTNKKLVISAFDTDFSFLIFIGFKNRRSHLKDAIDSYSITNMDQFKSVIHT